MIKNFIIAFVLWLVGTFVSMFLYSGEVTNIRTVDVGNGKNIILADIVQNANIVRKDYKLDSTEFYNAVTKTQNVTYCWIPYYVTLSVSLCLLSYTIFSKELKN